MVDIQVDVKEDSDDGWVFNVEVSDETGISNHQVTISKNFYERITDDETSPENLVKESFKFLLEREPKGSILSSFNLTDIGNYFPEYEDKIVERI